jgi:pimeloyl-ACP methyl ester carboxylesterase
MPVEPPDLPGVEHRWETANGIRIHYAEAGEGEPVVLQHGWPQHWWMWRHLIGPLAERFRVIVPDLRGHGWTDKPRSGYLKTELLEDTLGLLDKLGIQRFRYVGHDWGAYVGMLAALREPQRVERLVALSIPHPWQKRPPDPRVLANGVYQLILAGPLGRLAVRELNFGRVIFRRGRSAGSFSAEELAMYEDVLRQGDAAEATVQLYRSFLLHEFRPWANGDFKEMRLTVPTLWLVGEKDPLAKTADGGYREHADDMTLECIAGAGHFLPEELPQTVRERVLAFLP